MEFPDLGKNCSFLSCKQLDFLPIECIKCNLFFCKDHCLPFHHKCIKLVEEVKSDVVSNVPKSYPCTFSECKERELAPISCNLCYIQLCLKHRLPTDHDCVKQTIKKPSSLTPQEKVIKITGKELCTTKPSGRVGKKSSTTASKIVEMKLKMKAKGDNNIPVDERIYFDIQIIPKSLNEPMFFSKMHSVGKIIDIIACTVKLKNENHLANSLKLRLLTDDDVIIPADMKLECVLSNEEYNVERFGCVKFDYME